MRVHLTLAIFMCMAMGVTMAAAGLFGGSGPEIPANNHVKKLVADNADIIKSKAIQLLGNSVDTENILQCEEVKAISVKIQITRGTVNFIKVRIGNWTFHVKIFEDAVDPQPVTVEDVVGPKQPNEEIQMFN